MTKQTLKEAGRLSPARRTARTGLFGKFNAFKGAHTDFQSRLQDRQVFKASLAQARTQGMTKTAPQRTQMHQNQYTN